MTPELPADYKDHEYSIQKVQPEVSLPSSGTRAGFLAAGEPQPSLRPSIAGMRRLPEVARC